MTTDPARQPKGIPAGGEFAATTHAEPGITLAPERGYDAEEVLSGVLEDLRNIPYAWTSQIYYGTRDAIRSGATTPEAVLDGMLANNRSGRCKAHEYNATRAGSCNDCQVAFMVEARTNPKPAPVPRGVIPVRQENHYLKERPVRYYHYEDLGYSRTTSALTGDEKFDTAVRRMFQAPADAPVEVIQEESESGWDSTMESSTEITVKCGGREAVYDDLGGLMRALDRDEQPDPVAMALRFMRASSAERPLLQGVAAVYLHKSEYSDPVPVFGEIRDVFSGRDASIDFRHTDGRQEYVRLNRIVAILETDQSSIYEEEISTDED